jgi:zeta-carotene desaturase
MLAHADGYRLGLPACPLSRLYEKLPCRDVRLGVRAGELCFDGKRISGVKLTDGQTISVDAVVLATNHHSVQRWVDPAMDGRIGPLAKLEDVPILGVHMWFDRAVMKDSHAALLGGPLQWLFRKDDAGCVLHGVISAARDWVGRSKEESLKLFEEQVRATLPEAKEAKLVRGVIVIEKRATFSPGPGVERLRPSQAPSDGVENLFLAGDYTRTEWPATMEGAVRSGYLAAEAVGARVCGTESRFLVADLAVQWPARLLGLETRSPSGRG